MKGTVIIEGLRFFGRHGVGVQERKVGNTFEFNICITATDVPAMESDMLDGTISYADVVEIVRAENAQPSDLLENLAWRIHKRLTGQYPQIRCGSIEVYKVTPPISAELRRTGFLLEWP